MKKILVASFCAIILTTLLAQADTRTWGGSSGGDWFTASNWEENVVPEDGDNVIVDSGSIILDSATADLAEFTISGATLTFTNWTTSLIATNVTIESGGTINHAASTTNSVPGNTNRVWIIASNVTVNVNGAIDVTSKGYAGGRYNYTPPMGEGPGGGASQSDRGGGGGHGGAGGDSNKGTAGGGTYGSVTAPMTLGSGGGGGNGFGGAGGGAVLIDASGVVQVNGQIIADGGSINAQRGCGAGGSIYIQCHTFDGSGTLSAKGGGPNTHSGGGGGGRIAIAYDSEAQASTGSAPVTITVAGGTASNAEAGGDGTIHVNDTSILDSSNLKISGIITFDTISSWSPNSLSLSGRSLSFPSGFILSVTNDFLITDSSKLTLTYPPTLDVGGNLILTNSGTLAMYSAASNSLPYGGLVTVNGDVSVFNGSVLSLYSHPTNGGSFKFVVDSLYVDSGATIDADSKGFSGSWFLNTDHRKGYGPGGGDSSSDRGGGGGYGGAGGDANNGTKGGSMYGSSNAPAMPGSGAGGSNRDLGNNGGGLIWVFADNKIHVDGDLDADGGSIDSGQNGGGAGGGIYLKMRTFSGAGNLLARGGGGTKTYSGGGGGGRIAIEVTSDSFSGLVSVDPGTLFSTGEIGTIVRTIKPPEGTLITIK